MVLSDITEAFDEHMKAQPYGIKCADCHEDLGYEADVDSDGDLNLTVSPCEPCLQEAKAEAMKEAEA